MDIRKECPQCRKEFVCEINRNRKFCCDECKNQGKIDKQKTGECLFCKQIFKSTARKKYCSDKCSREYLKISFQSKNVKLNVCTATIGAIGELRVCVDLLIKGYDVYRSVSPAAGSDLVILKGNKLIRVEVTTGYINHKGNVFNNKKYLDNSKFDVVACILKSGEITYEPELEPVESDS